MTDLLTRVRAPWRRRSREAGAASAGFALALAAVLVAVVPWRSPAPWPTAVAREMPFREVLVEPGTVTAAKMMIYASRIAGGPAKIADIVQEGVQVEPGDVLVRFDSASFAQVRARETAALQQAEAELARAGEDLRIEGLQAGADLNQAREQIGYAGSTLDDETQGSGRLAVLEAEVAAAEAAREVDRARRSYDDLRPMLAEGFITQMELERAEQNWKRAAEQARLADLRLDTLRRYGRPAAIDRARAALRSTQEALDRQAQTTASRRAGREAAVALARARVDEIRARIAIIDDRLAHTVITAEGPGLVVYRDLFFGSDRRKPQVGDEVWSNQPLLALPDSSQLVVETRVREIDLHKVSASQAVHVTVEAYPGLRLPATVALVGALAQEDASRAGTKFFPVTVRLTAGDPRLRTGMTARVEIEVASLPSATVVPRQAVFEHDDRVFCYLLVNGRPERREVAVLADSGLEAAVTHIGPGDVVLLAEPEGTR